MDDRYANARSAPAIAPNATFRSIPVIARFVQLDGTEVWKPATAIRWDADTVLVGVGPTFHQEYTWLPAADVARQIRPVHDDSEHRRGSVV